MGCWIIECDNPVCEHEHYGAMIIQSATHVFGMFYLIFSIFVMCAVSKFTRQNQAGYMLARRGLCFAGGIVILQVPNLITLVVSFAYDIDLFRNLCTSTFALAGNFNMLVFLMYRREMRTGYGCASVPSYRLDTYAQQVMGSSQDDEQQQKTASVIDIVCVDAEGFDWKVLEGGMGTLQRTKYLEFEYNWRGPWMQQKPSDSAAILLEEVGMICYWAGMAGNLWRITGCWQDHYDLHFWSNVACVNPDLAPELAARIEEAFLTTLEAGYDIHYHNKSTMKTDGRI